MESFKVSKVGHNVPTRSNPSGTCGIENTKRDFTMLSVCHTEINNTTFTTYAIS